MSKYQYLKKEELISKILNLGGVSREEVDKMGRRQMIERLDAEAALSTATPEATPESSPQAEQEVPPLPNSPEWSEYLLGQLTENELIDKRPTCDGLRRIFKAYMGDIMISRATVVDHPRAENYNRATILYQITYQSYHSGKEYEVSDVADCSIENTKVPFCNFPTATAATMAESRCLRKAMGLKAITSEESQSVTEEEIKIKLETTLASTNQKHLINKIAERNEIDVTKLLNYMTTIKSKSLDLLSDPEAKEIINKLNLMQRGPDNGGEIIPAEVMA